MIQGHLFLLLSNLTPYFSHLFLLFGTLFYDFQLPFYPQFLIPVSLTLGTSTLCLDPLLIVFWKLSAGSELKQLWGCLTWILPPDAVLA